MNNRLHLRLSQLRASFTLFIVSGAVGTLFATPPENVSSHTVRLEMADTQVARTAPGAAPCGPWYRPENVSDMALNFPTTGDNTFRTVYPRPGGGEEQANISYTPSPADNRACISMKSADFSVAVTLNFVDARSGTAEITWTEAGESRHFRGITFTMNKEGAAEGISLPEEQFAGDPEVWDDGLQDILRRLTDTHYRSATERLYQTRLRSLLPLVMVFFDASYTSPDFKGNTALHYACGLSHTELVQWLVDHGADLEARTEKGATVDACISGRHAQAIRNILAQARRERDYPLRGPQAEEHEAALAVNWLEAAFTCRDINSAHYEVPKTDEKAQEHAELLYLYVRQNRAMPPHVDKTEPLGHLLTWLLRANVHRGMFTDALQKQLWQLRTNALRELQRDGLALAILPHMILMREQEGMNHDGATALYRACVEGNVPLVKWLLEHGAERRLTDNMGNAAEIPTNTPNADVLRALLTDSTPGSYLAPAELIGKTLTITREDTAENIIIRWKHQNSESEREDREDESWCMEERNYTRTGNNTATVTRLAQWSPGGHYAAGWTTLSCRLSFTSATEGTADCTETTRQGEPQSFSATFTIR